MQRKLLILGAIIGGLLAFAGVASATTILDSYQGGTGFGFPGNVLPGAILFGNYGNATLATSTNLTFATSTNKFSTTYASTTGASGNFLCLGSDCRTAWPSGGGSTFGTTSISALLPLIWNTSTAQLSTLFSTSSNNTFTGQNIFQASTTIGNGTQAGGLTISGGATTTGNAYFAGNVGIGTPSPAAVLSVVSGNPASPYSGVSLLSGASGSYTAYTIGRTVPEGYWGVAGATNHYLTGTAAGDTAIIHTGKLLFGSTISGAAQVTMDTGGNVGIGTSPTDIFDVYSTKVGGDTLSFKNANTADYMYLGIHNNSDKQLALISYGDTQPGTIFGNNRAGSAVVMGYNPSSAVPLLVGTFGAANLTLGTNNTANVTIQNGGNVGIGTTSPFTNFAVQGNGYLSGNLTAANVTATGTLTVAGVPTSGTVASALQGYNAFYNANGTTISGTSTLFMSQKGLVGIGTTTPDDALSVQALSNDVDSFDVYSTGGAETFGVSNAGLVGVNTPSPWATLSVTGGLGVTASSTIGNGTQTGGLTISGGATTTGVSLHSAGSATNPAIAFIQDFASGIYQAAAGTLSFVTGGIERMTIAANGNIGVGSTTPWGAFSIASTSPSYTNPLFTVATSTGMFGNLFSVFATTKSLGFGDWGTRVMIGTTSPLNGEGDQLFVDGRINSSWHEGGCEGETAWTVVTGASGSGINSYCPSFIGIAQSGASGFKFGGVQPGGLGEDNSSSTNLPAIDANYVGMSISSGTGVIRVGYVSTGVMGAVSGGMEKGLISATTTPSVLEFDVANIGDFSEAGAIVMGTTSVYMGYMNYPVSTNAVLVANEPMSGSYFAATSANNNWQAVFTNHGLGTSTTDTGLASTTPINQFNKFRIELGSTTISWYINDTLVKGYSPPQADTDLLQVAFMETNGATAVLLDEQANMFIAKMRFWYLPPYSF